MEYEALESVGRRRRNIRIILFVIILGTLPFYCAGFFLWGTARPRLQSIATPEQTNTPIGADITPTVGLPTITPLNLTPTLLSPLQPTPLQFVPINRPPTSLPPTATVYLVPIIPTDTLAPTLTLIPSATPLPSATPAPSVTPPPTETPVPTNTEVLPPTQTPLPFDEPTLEAPVDPGS